MAISSEATSGEATPLQGLTSAEVNARHAAGQGNELPPRSGRTTSQIIRANVFTRINALLGVLFVAVMLTGSWINGAFGLLIIANSIIGIVQELRAKRTLDSLAVIGEAHPTVRRDGAEQRVDQDAVVLGDIIVVTPGEQIVVDGEVAEASYLEMDESLLTGESEAVAKKPGDEVLSAASSHPGRDRTVPPRWARTLTRPNSPPKLPNSHSSTPIYRPVLTPSSSRSRGFSFPSVS